MRLDYEGISALLLPIRRGGENNDSDDEDDDEYIIYSNL